MRIPGTVVGVAVVALMVVCCRPSYDPQDTAAADAVAEGDLTRARTLYAAGAASRVA